VVDIFSKAKRSEVMSKIRGRNTRPEQTLRSLLHRAGFRFRLHNSRLPGTPDIVLPRYRTVIMVHGCFWHRHPRCRFAYEPKTRVAFWRGKFAENIARDRRVKNALRKLGWRVITIWECELTNADRVMANLRLKLPVDR
jgi:DNA mismatch endonuclease (patch repair protein)